MKKIILTLGAVLAFGIASAQTDPKQPPQPQAPPETPKTDIQPKSLEDAEIQNDAVSNNPKKRVGLIGYGLEVVENLAIKIDPNPHNERYLKTKKDKLGHEIL